MAKQDARQESPTSEQLEQSFNDAGLEKGKAIIARTNPALFRRSRLRMRYPSRAGSETPDRVIPGDETPDAGAVAERMDALRQVAATRDLVFKFDKQMEAENIPPLGQDVLWAVLAGYAVGELEVPHRALIAGVADRGSRQLEVACLLAGDGCLLRSGLIEHDDETPRNRCYSALPALLGLIVGDGAGLRSKEGARETSREDNQLRCESYHEYLDLIVSHSEALLGGLASDSEDDELENEIPPLPRRRRRSLARRASQAEKPKIEVLEERVVEERESGRWSDSPLTRIASIHGLSRAEERVLVFLALRGSPLEDEDTERVPMPFHRRAPRGVPGSVLLRLLASERSGRWAARGLLYAESPLRQSGLVQIRGNDQDAPEMLRFGVDETTVRRILGHIDLDEKSAAARPRKRAKGRLVDVMEPEVTLADVVLPEQARESIDRALESLRDPDGSSFGLAGRLQEANGMTLALTGPSGTGKTLTAEALAGELDMVLMKVHVPSLLSKWVGESQKNIAAAFRRAAGHKTGAVLFFDEADSLFFDREGALHSWEVQDVNVLLTEIEQHEGVVVLATNRRDALDRALSRRVLLTVELPRPGVAEREAIWLLHLPSSEHLANDVDPAALAQAVDLTGGEIRNAVLEAVRRARFRGIDRLGQETLLGAAQSVRTARWGDNAQEPVGF